jgi:DNA invertase Pin-like site-specific DNA recombinase
MMKAIGYFRVLSDISDTDPDILSPQVEQEKGFYSFCQEQGYDPVTTFMDVDSGDKVSEIQYQHMIRYIRKQQEDFHIVVKNLPHLHRDAQEAVRCLLELDGLGVNVLFTDEALDDPLAAALQAWSTRPQSAGSGERVKEAMRVRAMYGRALGKPPFGYRIGDNQKLEVVPEEADVVSLIYKLYLQENRGVRLIARYLNEQGITTKKGNRWSIVGIRDILRNRSYLGTYSRFGVKIPGSHPSIIPPSVFNRVQERLSAEPRKGVYATRLPFLLAGLAYCGHCGNTMIGVNRRQTWTRRKDGGKTKGEYRYYQCQSRANQSFCQYHTRRAGDLESMVLARLQRFSKPEAREQLIKQHASTIDSKTTEQAQLMKKQKALNKKFRGYLDKAAQGDISLDELRATGGELVKERQFLEQRLALLEAEASGEITSEQRRRHTIESLDNIQERWESMTFPARRALLQYVIDRIMVYDHDIDTVLRL